MRATSLLFLLTAVLATSVALASSTDLRDVRVEDDGAYAASRAGGSRVELTLDPALQRDIERLLERSRAPEGAIVMVDTRTGKVLAWATQGSQDDLVRTPRFPAASLMKVVTAASLLEGGHAYRGTPQCYSGGLRRLHEEDIEKMCRPGEPKIDFGQALGRSINVVFGRLAAHRLDSDDLRDMTARLGFGASVPFDLPAGTSHVVIPDDELGRARAAAGFHEGAVSPLSALYLMTTVANRGVARPLRILASSPAGQSKRLLDEATANALRRMLRVTTTRGTSRKAFREQKGRPNMPAAGKTGTLGVTKPRRLLSWFAGFAPADDPQVAVAVMLANDYKWWRKANQVARDALDAYFAGR